MLVTVLRVASLLGFAAPLLLAGRRRTRNERSGPARGGRTPALANLTSFGVLFPSLFIFPGTSEGHAAILFASTGCLVSVAGAALVLRSRMELGSAWSLVPRAEGATGLVTTGPYRLVRHPIYLGFSMLAMGGTLAFASGPALLVVLAGVVPTFVWRAFAEEKLLAGTFGERYARYRTETRMIIPSLL